MNRTMITASNTMSQLQKQLDNIGHNLANINTTGYKKRDIQFNELLVQQFHNQHSPADATGRLTPTGIRQGVGAKLGQTILNLAQGSIQQTNRPLDLAFIKEGQFLQVGIEENGLEATRLTGNGALYLSPLANGSDFVSLVNADGLPVLDVDGDPIVFTNQFKELKISETGRISVLGNDGQPIQEFDLAVVQVNKPQLLEAQGNNLFSLPNGINNVDAWQLLVGDARNQIGVTQGALEQANVDMATEMTDLMVTQRSYQFNAKSISLADQMMGLVNGIR